MDAFRKIASRYALWGMLGGAFLARLLVALQDLNTLLALNIPDDAFYYFKIAENVASGRGSSFDGFQPTNGYQPLWLCLLTPLFSRRPTEPTLPSLWSWSDRLCSMS